jgi:transcriptional regulator with XRE-family HTH domain
MRREIRKPKPKKHSNHLLLDYLAKECGAKTDMNIAARLGTTSSYISHIRNGNATFGPKLILAAYDAFGISIEKIRELLQHE